MNRHGECVPPFLGLEVGVELRRKDENPKMDEKVCLFMIWTGNALKMGENTMKSKKKKKVFLEKHYF